MAKTLTIKTNRQNVLVVKDVNHIALRRNPNTETHGCAKCSFYDSRYDACLHVLSPCEYWKRSDAKDIYWVALPSSMYVKIVQWTKKLRPGVSHV